MKKLFISLSLVTLLAGPVLCAEKDVPWWKEQKIRFMWGTWGHSSPDKSIGWDNREVPREVVRNVARSGATVFADRNRYIPAHARYAKEFGMRYFAGTRSRHPLWYTSGRAWVNENGEKEMRDVKFAFKCPLDAGVYQRWLIDPHLEGVRQGLIDGICIDWEAGGLPLTACYCDDCFSKFPVFKKTGDDVPGTAKRFAWLQNRSLVDTYKQYSSQQQIAMLTRIRETLHEANPDLLFASYPMEVTNFSRAMNTPKTPFIFLDARHYTNGDRQPWWESYGERLRQDGYLYIPGSWTNTLFGSMPSQVSAERWLYEASINEDGSWMWFEHELTEDMLRAYSAADRAIRAVEDRVGAFLFHGERDLTFVTAVEWTGRPELEQAIVHQAYHLGREHLVHINNVHSDWPLRVRVRFPRLVEGKRWTVRDPMGEQYYTRDGKSAIWTTAELLAGVVVAMETRSDLFLLVAPEEENFETAPARLMHSREFDTLPGHAAASAQSGPIPGKTTHPPKAGRLVYTATETMGIEGLAGVHSIISNAIRTVDSDGTNGLRVRQLHGHLWSPQYAPNGRQIAFVHNASGRGQIFVMNADGTNAVNISNNDFCDRSPVWSPHGKFIAFVSDRGGDWNIFTMNADGSDQRLLAGNPGLDRAPRWSPDGQRILWESHTSGTPNAWVCHANGENSHPVIRKDGQITHQMAKEWERTPVIEDVEPVFPDNTPYLWDPVWSPDGKRIAAGALNSVAGETPVVIAADGSSVLQLLYAFTGIDNVTWSPDGTWLAGTLRCAPQESERSGIFVIKADGTDGRTRGYWIVDVSPQGPRLGGTARGGPVTWYSHGSAQPRRVVKTFSSLAWSPDGQTLAFSSDMDPSGAFYVYTISPKDGEPKRLDATMSAWPNEIMWQPMRSP